MFINKIGKDHIEMGINCQDYGMINDQTKLVCDGCGSAEHSEVGAKLFCHLYSMIDYTMNSFKMYINKIFYNLIGLIGNSNSDLKNYLSFTILCVTKTADGFNTCICGDGYLIIQDINGNITFKKIDNGTYPKYYIYNFVENREMMDAYKDGVTFDEEFFGYDSYINIGVASDGIRFIVESENEELEQEFIDILKSGSEIKMKRFINKNQSVFKDDVTIAF